MTRLLYKKMSLSLVPSLGMEPDNVFVVVASRWLVGSALAKGRKVESKYTGNRCASDEELNASAVH